MRIKAYQVGRTRQKTRDIPSLVISGDWLSEIGFEPDSKVAVICSDKRITLKHYYGTEDDYEKLSKRLMRSGMGGIVNVRNTIKGNSNRSHIYLQGRWLDNYGFGAGTRILLKYDMDVIVLEVIDESTVSSLIS